jgi:soluble lytic murein transglycosylase-like protein
MMKNKKKLKTIFIASVILLIFFSSFHPIFAQPYTNQEKIPGAQPTSEFIPYVQSIINFGFAIIGILALFMLIIGAYQYLMAAGSGKAEDAKDTITSALLGLALGLTAWVILNKINPDLVKMNPISTISGGGAAVGGAGGTTPIPTSYTSNAPAEIQQKAKEYAAKNNVPEAVAMKMLSMESGGGVGAVSPKGASGLLQLMPGTARDLGVTDIFNVDQNLNAGYKYANQLNQKYNGDWGLTMAAYNWGTGNVDSYLKNGYGVRGPVNGQMPKETINYVNKIMGSCSFCPKT